MVIFASLFLPSTKSLARKCLLLRNMSNSSASVVRVGVGCFVVDPVNHPGCFLVGTRRGSHGAGKLALPGGHLEMNESWENCALREVQEETNLTVHNLHLFNVTNDVSIDGNPLKHYITLFMVGTVTTDSPELQNMEPHKCDSWDWISWQQLLTVLQETPERLFEPMRNLIARSGKETPQFLVCDK